MKILQVGLGNFGKRHLEAWHRLGFGDRLWICEPDDQKWKQTERYRFPKDRLVRSIDCALQAVEVVDLVTPTTTHFPLGQEVLQAGKDLFIEKPMTMTSVEAKRMNDLAQRNRCLIQVGFYYRYHPASVRLRQEIVQGTFGRIRYLSGNFMGFKRARTDVGVTHTDGIHFLDLFNWLLEGEPVEVYAIFRDHFGRGLEDLSVVLLTYPDGTCAKVESGYIQPGRWMDKVVPGAMTSKEILLSGERSSAEIDFEAQTLTIYEAHHEPQGGTWVPLLGNTWRPTIESCDPVELICRELEAFLLSVETRQPTSPGPVDGGVQLATLMECIWESARSRRPVQVRTTAEVSL